MCRKMGTEGLVELADECVECRGMGVVIGVALFLPPQLCLWRESTGLKWSSAH